MASQAIDATTAAITTSATTTGQLLLMQAFRHRRAGSYTVYLLALQPSKRVCGSWERIGHGRYVTWDRDAPHVDLFWGGKTRNLLLV